MTKATPGAIRHVLTNPTRYGKIASSPALT